MSFQERKLQGYRNNQEVWHLCCWMRYVRNQLVMYQDSCSVTFMLWMPWTFRTFWRAWTFLLVSLLLGSSWPLPLEFYSSLSTKLRMEPWVCPQEKFSEVAAEKKHFKMFKTKTCFRRLWATLIILSPITLTYITPTPTSLCRVCKASFHTFLTEESMNQIWRPKMQFWVCSEHLKSHFWYIFMFFIFF